MVVTKMCSDCSLGSYRRKQSSSEVKTYDNELKLAKPKVVLEASPRSYDED